MNVNAIPFLRVAIAANMILLFQNETAKAFLFQFKRANRTEESRSDDQYIVRNSPGPDTTRAGGCSHGRRMGGSTLSEFRKRLLLARAENHYCRRARLAGFIRRFTRSKKKRTGRKTRKPRGENRLRNLRWAGSSAGAALHSLLGTGKNSGTKFTFNLTCAGGRQHAS